MFSSRYRYHYSYSFLPDREIIECGREYPNEIERSLADKKTFEKSSIFATCFTSTLSFFMNVIQEFENESDEIYSNTMKLLAVKSKFDHNKLF